MSQVERQVQLVYAVNTLDCGCRRELRKDGEDTFTPCSKHKDLVKSLRRWFDGP